MFRLPYKHSPQEMVRQHAHGNDECDFAEAMFGMVDKERAVAGRVFVTDAEIYEEDRRGDHGNGELGFAISFKSCRPPFKCI